MTASALIMLEHVKAVPERKKQAHLPRKRNETYHESQTNRVKPSCERGELVCRWQPRRRRRCSTMMAIWISFARTVAYQSCAAFPMLSFICPGYRRQSAEDI